MAKLALLIGVSEYEDGFHSLPGAVKDIEAMQRVLQAPNVGEFTQVKTLEDPDRQMMEGAIENLFTSCTRDDLVLLFFSGHGVKDDSGRLYFAARNTRKNPQGDLVKSTAVPATFVHEIMSNSRSKRQVIILDCCFSGAFAAGLTAKDDGIVDIQEQLGGEGRAVLTSSTSTQYSFEQANADLSVYTRYIVEGIETGAADLDSDGEIEIDELHDYARRKVQETAPAMKPKMYAVEEGFRIVLARAPMGDPALTYRREVERCVHQGEISFIGRSTLDTLRDRLGLAPEAAATIEADVLKPSRDYQTNLQHYKQLFEQATQREHPLSEGTRTELKHFQHIVGLRDDDIAIVEAGTAVLTPNPRPNPPPRRPPRPSPAFDQVLAIVLKGGAIATVLVVTVFLLVKLPQWTVPNPSPTPSPSPTVTDSPPSTPETPAPAPSKTAKDYFESAQASKKADDYPQAKQDYDEAIRLNPNYAEAFKERGDVLSYHWDALNLTPRLAYQTAIQDYDQAIALNPNYTNAYNNRGETYQQLGNVPKAIADFTQAIQLKPDFSLAYYQLSEIYNTQAQQLAKAQNWQEAIAAWQQAIFNCTQAISRNGYWGSANLADAQKFLAKAYYDQGMAYLQLGQAAVALQDFQATEKLAQQQGNTALAQQARSQIQSLSGTPSPTVTPIPMPSPIILR